MNRLVLLSALFATYAAVAIIGRQPGEGAFGILTGYACLFASLMFGVLAAWGHAVRSYRDRPIPSQRFEALNQRNPSGTRSPNRKDAA